MINKLIPLFSTLGGALIGALVAYLVAWQQFKANVLSKNRQEWINNLRELLAQYEATLYNVHAYFTLNGATQDAQSNISNLMEANLIRSKVKLMINPKENDHIKLIDLMFEMDTSASHAGEKYTVQFTKLDKEFVCLAQNILKREWERVKRGK